MSMHHLRNDKTCLNCGTLVEQRFCSNCGQENIETRQSFAHLVKHFFEDITHYEGSFWRTMKYLLFRPGFLTKEYLAGKRKTFLPPVRLYIFVSFLTFFIPYFMPESDEGYKYPLTKKEKADKKDTVEFGVGFGNSRIFFAKSDYASLKQLDSLESLLPPEKRFNALSYWMEKKILELSAVNPDKLEEEFLNSFSKNIPKALFVYMPLFALAIWLFHGKKRWLYFDHAIFTLHYFSFLLLVFTFLNIVNTLFTHPALFSHEVAAQIFVVITVVLTLGWFFYYLFKAHKIMYEEKPSISFLKSFFILALNLSIFFMVMLGLGFVTMFSIH